MHARFLYLPGLLAGLLAGRPAPAAPLPPDTIPGHAELVHKLADSLCVRLAAKRRQVDFRTLPARQSAHLLDVLLHQLTRENRPDVENILLAVRPEKRVRYRRQLGRDLLLYLAASCSTARQVITDINFRSLHDPSPMSPAEQAVLVPIAWRIGQVLGAEDRRDPLEDRPRDEEKQLIQQVMQASMLEALPELSAHYGSEAVRDPAGLAHIGERLTFVLLNTCPQYVLMLTLKH